MPHFFIKSTDINGEYVLLNDEDNYQHIARSLRAKTGERLLLIDENKMQYETVITSITNKQIESKIEKKYPSKRKLGFNLYLAQSPLRSDAQAAIIEKATELGVAGVYPILTDNCALKKDVIIKKVPKWQRIMQEASKQCERADIPACFELTTLEAVCSAQNFDAIIAFCERCSDITFREFCSERENLFDNSNILVIIGPEGGFSEREFNFFKENNIAMLTLGDLILKAETAVITGLGNIIYEYNNHRKN